MFSPGLIIIPHYWGKTFWGLYQCSMNYEVFCAGWWEQTLSLALSKCQVVFSLILLDRSFFSLGSFFHMLVLINTLEYLKVIFWKSLEFFLCSALSSLALCPVNFSCLYLPRLSAPSPRFTGPTGSTWVRIFFAVAWELFKAESWDNQLTHQVHWPLRCPSSPLGK